MAPLPKNTIQHFTHPSHPLLDMYEDREYLCDGCKTLGFGKKYRCESCDFDLHEQCATCPTTLSSFFMHPQHQLNLVVRNSQATRQNLRVCDVCADEVEGLFYRCNLCEFDVHPLCTQFPQNVRHAIHPAHPLMLQPSSASYCLVCKSLCTSWRYRCGICCVDLHLECVLEPCDESYQHSVPPPYQPPPPPPPAYGGYVYGVPSESSQRSVPPPYQPPPPAYGGYAYETPSESSQRSVLPPCQPPPPPAYGGYAYGMPSKSSQRSVPPPCQPPPPPAYGGYAYETPSESSQRLVPPPCQPPPPPAYGGYAYGMPSESPQCSVPPPYQPPPPPAYGGYAYEMPSESSQWSVPPPYQPPPPPGPPPAYGAYPYGVPYGPYNMYGQCQGYGMPPSGFSPYNMYPYHDHGKCSGSSPYNTYQDQSQISNLKQAEGARGATNGKPRSKKRKIFLIVGRLALGVVGTAVFGFPGLSSLI